MRERYKLARMRTGLTLSADIVPRYVDPPPEDPYASEDPYSDERNYALSPQTRPEDYPAVSAQYPTYTNERGDIYVSSDIQPYMADAPRLSNYMLYPAPSGAGAGANTSDYVVPSGSRMLDSTGVSQPYQPPIGSDYLVAPNAPRIGSDYLVAPNSPGIGSDYLVSPGGQDSTGTGPVMGGDGGDAGYKPPPVIGSDYLVSPDGTSPVVGSTAIGPDGKSVYWVGPDGKGYLTSQPCSCVPCPGVWFENQPCRRPAIPECIRRECTDWRRCNKIRQSMSPLFSYQTGDLLCPGVDVDKFKLECQAPVFPNQWNHWRLYRTTRDNPTDQEVIDTALAFLGKITTPMDMGKIRHEDIVVIKDNSVHENPWKTHIIMNRLECTQSIQLAHSDFNPAYRTVYVRFVYRGSRDKIPWPVRKVSSIGLGSWCPLDADWILDSVFAPSSVNVPAESTDPILPGYVEQGVPEVTLDYKQKALLWGLGIGAVAAMVGYGIRSVR